MQEQGFSPNLLKIMKRLGYHEIISFFTVIFKQAPPMNNGTQSAVGLGIDLLWLDNVDPLRNSYHATFVLEFEWTDDRLKWSRVVFEVPF